MINMSHVAKAKAISYPICVVLSHI